MWFNFAMEMSLLKILTILVIMATGLVSSTAYFEVEKFCKGLFILPSKLEPNSTRVNVPYRRHSSEPAFCTSWERKSHQREKMRLDDHTSSEVGMNSSTKVNKLLLATLIQPRFEQTCLYFADGADLLGDRIYRDTQAYELSKWQFSDASRLPRYWSIVDKKK